MVATLTQRLEVLKYVRDVYTTTAVYTFLSGPELDQSYQVASGTIAVPNAPYGYDTIGGNAAPLQLPRHTSWKVFHKYTGNETWTSLKRDMMLAFGHNRPVLLEKILPDGTELIAEARLSSFPDAPDIDSEFRVVFSLVFEQREDWHNKDISSLRYDTGLHYDAGHEYDLRGVKYLLAGAHTTVNLINNGTINELDGIFTLDGPITAPTTVTNFSCDVRGIPAPPGTIPQAPMYFQILTNLASLEYFTINQRTNEITSNRAGIVPWQQVRKNKGQLRYFEVVPGTNVVTVDKGDGAASGDFFAAISDRYRA